MRNGLKIALTGVSLIALSTPALAQDASDANADSKEDIVVTGTLIRGAAPVGQQAITLGQQKLEETGAISSNELLASIPQVTNYFNKVPVSDLAIAVNQIQISRPNLRNISGNNAASAATLILMDGHRIATAGVNQASVDPDLIPTGAIERVEVVTEGGSATYGADAVAGVINFITRKKFDGIKLDGHYGVAKDYWQWDASLTAGKSWATGSAWIAYTYTKNDALYGRERDFIRNQLYTSQPYVGRDVTCGNPNLAVNTVIQNFGVTIASTNYAAPGFAAGTFNRCDNSQNSTVVPRAERHGAMAGLTQELGDKTSLDVRVYYGQRKTHASSELTGTVTVGSGNPYASSLPAGLVLGTIPGFTILGSPVVNRAQVSFSLTPLLGLDAARADTNIKQWGANAEIKHEFDNGWQLRGLLNYSSSDSRYELTNLNSTRLNAAGAATTTAAAFNPFNIAANSRTLVADIADNMISGQAKDDLLNFRLIAEGKLFSLPGGDARLAVGYEFMHDKLQQRFQSDIRIGTLGSFPFSEYSRNVHSLFGEVQLPLIARGDGGAMVTVQGSLRYDHYSDFGNTTNPKVGVTFKPVEWFGLRGNWGTSFTAPTPLDQLGSARNTINAFPFVAFTRPGDTPVGGSFTVAIQGSQPNLKPQTADTWSIGFDASPPFIPGLRASMSYYAVKFENILGTPTPNAGIFTDFPGNITSNPTGLSAAQIRAFAALVPNGSAVVEPLIAAGTPVYELVDFRVGNFGILNVRGIDFSVNYNRPTSFGSIDFSVDGNAPLTRKQQVSPTSTVVDSLATENPHLFLQTSAGVNIGNFRGQVTWNHTGGYDIAPTASVPVQTRVGSFNTVNLFFKYDVQSESKLFKDLSFTLNVNNVADQAPPVLLRNNPNELGYANGFTLGRMFIFGISKKF